MFNILSEFIAIIYSKTMTVIAKLVGEKHSIQKIVINKEGDRVLGIDSSGYVIVWRFNLLTKIQKASVVLKGLDAVDACFTSNGSNIAILTKEYLLSYDLLRFDTDKTKILKHNKIGSVNGGSIIEFLPALGYCIVVAPKKDKVLLYNMKERNEMNYIKIKDAEITSCTINSLGTMFALGFSDGIVRTYYSRTMQ